jgi:hypothetical protein
MNDDSSVRLTAPRLQTVGRAGYAAKERKIPHLGHLSRSLAALNPPVTEGDQERDRQGGQPLGELQTPASCFCASPVVLEAVGIARLFARRLPSWGPTTLSARRWYSPNVVGERPSRSHRAR